MPRLSSFTQVSLDGYYAGTDGDFRWAMHDPTDAEWNAFVSGNASSGGVLLFGRVTYQLMANWWPTPAAAQMDPIVAKGMNAMPKVVFSRTLERAEWSGTRLVKGDLLAEARRMKETPGDDMAILGSGSIVSQLAEAGLIDELQIVVNPIVLGTGKSLFGGVREKIRLRHTRTRTFGNGCMLLCYEPRA